MLVSLLLAVCLSIVSSDPGTPWTEEESLIVKSKIWAVMESGRIRAREYLALHKGTDFEDTEDWPEKKSLPNAAKFLRLGFHQCLKNSDGSGGCNGCLNNHGMGLENRHNCSPPDDKTVSQKREDLPDALKTDNAGLEITADILEEIFVNKNFPSSAQALKISLADSGKSRADLWTFASTVAVEWGVIRNNRGCDGEPIGELDQDHKICHHLRQMDADCKIEWPEPLKFYTGRSDCSSEPGLKSWETTVEESHPNPQGNGQMTADFFKKDFDLTARESAALLIGGHSIGKFNFEISQFKYDWTKNQKSFLNNQLFRNVAMKPQYFVDCRKENPYVGDYLGQPAVSRWRVVGRKCGYAGGPYQWFHQYYRCPASNTCSGVNVADLLISRTPELPYPEHPCPENTNCGDIKEEDDDDDRKISLMMRAE